MIQSESNDSYKEQSCFSEDNELVKKGFHSVENVNIQPQSNITKKKRQSKEINHLVKNSEKKSVIQKRTLRSMD